MFDVITIGTATQDVFLESSFFKVLHDPEHLKKIGFEAGEAQCFALGGKIEIKKPVFTTGGGATNTAVTFGRQGFKTAALIKIGQDEAGQKITEELKKEKVKAFVHKNSKADTAYGTVLLAPNGERTILVYRGAGENWSEADIPLRKLKSGWIYLSPGTIDFEIIEKLINHFYEKGVSIAINPSKNLIEKKLSGLKNILSKSHVVVLNREEASYLTGIDYNDEKKIFEHLDMAVKGIAVMTDGGKGVLVSDGFKLYQAGIFKGSGLVDRTGAGDAFASGFVAGLMEKKEKCEKGLCELENLEYAIRLGSANATSVIEQIGAKAGILTKKEFAESPRWKNFPIKITNLK